jgi:hypothetical protein
MRLVSLLFFSSFSLQVVTAASVSQTWNELQAKREALKAFTQEFEISRTFKTGQGRQASKSSVVLDASTGHWREGSISGAGGRITVFDGKDLFRFEDGDNEYTRAKLSSNDELRQPDPYRDAHLDFSKAVEQDNLSCGLSNVEHKCVMLDIPVKPWIRNGPGSEVRMMGGSTRLVVDTVTGLLISSRTLQNVDNHHSGYYLTSLTCLSG